MIGKLKLWTSNIIVSVVISIIIEMLLPEGNNKKYVKVITGIYILYVIVNPVFDFVNISGNSLALDDILQEQTIQTYSNVNVAEVYVLSLENALKSRIEELGYEVNYIQFYVTSDYANIVKIEIKMKSGSKYDVQQIQKIVLETYDLAQENIIVE